MADTERILRKGTTAEHAVFIGAAGEITYDLTSNRVVLHNGIATGGFPLVKTLGTMEEVVLGHPTAVHHPGAGEIGFNVIGSTSGINGSIEIAEFSETNTADPSLFFLKSGNAIPGGFTIVAINEDVGDINWHVDDGTDYVSSVAKITVQMDGVPGVNDTPGRMILYTTPAGSPTPLEALRLDSSQNTIVAGNITAKGGTLIVGVDDTTQGTVIAHGGVSGNEGGEIRLQLNADFDSAFENYAIDAHQDDLRIFGNGSTTTYRNDGTWVFPTNVLIGDTLAAFGSPQLDVIDATGLQLVLSDVVTDATDKGARVGVRHYTIAEQNTCVFFADNQTAINRLNIGGGTASLNTVTAINFFTAADTITITGTQRATITSAGDFGIGDPSPNGRLHVKDDSATSPRFIFEDGFNGASSPLFDLINNRAGGASSDGDTFGLRWLFHDSAGVAQKFGQITVVSDDVTVGTKDSTMNFDTVENDSIVTPLTLKGLNVGINESAPGGQLHVTTGSGSGATASTDADDSIIDIDSAVTGGESILTADGKAGFLRFTSPTGNHGIISSQYTSGELVISASKSTGIIKLQTNSGQERMRIFANGDVGIGAFGGGSADGKLHVLDGSAGSVIAGSGANTGIFESDGNTGISLLNPDGFQGVIQWKTPTAGASGLTVEISMEDDSDGFQIATFVSGADITFKPGVNNETLRLTGEGNVLINAGTATNPASADAALCLFNGTVPTGSVANGVVLYAEDVTASSELKVRDEGGTVTVLSPHNFSMFDPDINEDLPWSYHCKSELLGKEINVDIAKLCRLVEELTGEKLIYEKDIPKKDIAEEKQERINQIIEINRAVLKKTIPAIDSLIWNQQNTSFFVKEIPEHEREYKESFADCKERLGDIIPDELPAWIVERGVSLH